MIKTLISSKVFELGFEVRTEIWEQPGCSPLTMISAYTPSGLYIGKPALANRLCKAKGIVLFENASGDGGVANIGYSSINKTWYGWSHRAICGFKKGDKLFEEQFLENDKTPFKKAGIATILTLEQARQAAVNFALYVG